MPDTRTLIISTVQVAGVPHTKVWGLNTNDWGCSAAVPVKFDNQRLDCLLGIVNWATTARLRLQDFTFGDTDENGLTEVTVKVLPE